MKIISDDKYRLITGTEFYSNRNIVGINPKLELSEGYDTELSEEHKFTMEEKIELANYMIKLWEMYKIKARMTYTKYKKEKKDAD